MDRSYLARCVPLCCFVLLSSGLLLPAARGETGSGDVPGVVPDLLEEVVDSAGLVADPKPQDDPAAGGVLVPDPDLPADGSEPDPDLPVEDPADDGAEGSPSEILPPADAESRNWWWSFMGDVAAELPRDDEVLEDSMGAGLFAGDPDAFEDLDAPLGPIGLGGSSRNVEAFDAEIRRSELLSGGFQSPLERQGWRFGMGVQSIYDSNVYAETVDEVSDLSLVVSPSVEYRSAPAGVPGQITLRYTPFIRLYLAETDLNTVDHSANGSVSFTGTRGRFQVSANYGLFASANQYTGGLRETESLGVQASTAYQLAPRTSLEASLSASKTESTGLGRTGVAAGGGNDQESLQLQVAAYWQATPKTRFGPSVRYSKSTSTSIGDRDALAFLVVADYVPRDELSFSGSLGVERVGSDAAFDQDSTSMTGSFGVNYRPDDRITLGADLSYQAIPAGSRRATRTGGGQQSFTGGLSLGYTPNPDWSFGVNVSADAFPSEDSSNYSIGDQSFGASVTRQLPQGSLSLSGRMGFSTYDALGPVTDARDGQDYRSLSLRYQRPVLAERGSFHSAIQWSDNSGDRDWQRWQITLGMDMAF